MIRSIHALGVSFLESTLGMARALTIRSLERPLLGKADIVVRRNLAAEPQNI
jgi:hypothetical protein